MTARPRRELTEQAADAAVDQACRMLRLPTIRAQFPDLAEAAAREQMSYRGYLAELLMAECDDRNRRRSERQIKAAGFLSVTWNQGPGSGSLRYGLAGNWRETWWASSSSGRSGRCWAVTRVRVAADLG